MIAELTLIAVLLDRSGSMADVAADTIGGFNEFLHKQQERCGRTNLTLVQFDSVDPFEVLYRNTPVREVPDLTSATFVPRGGTPLLDALGRTITDVGAQLATLPEHKRPAKVVLVVITDGQENSSREFTRSRVFDMISHQRETYKWEVMFLGANQDAITEAGQLGIGSALTYQQSGVGVRAMFTSTSAKIGDYVDGTVSNTNFTDEDVKAYNDAVAAETPAPQPPKN